MKWTQALLIVLTLTPSPAFAQSDEVRIDTFDKHSNRTGYLTIDRRTGRVDRFDTRGNRLGYGTTTTTPYGTRIDTFTPSGTRTGSGTLSMPRR